MKSQIVPELLNRRNTVFAKKEADSTLLQDLALIEASEAFFGHGCGVTAFPWFVGKIASEFGVDRNNTHFGSAIKPDEQYNFMTGKQNRYWGHYTTDDLIAGFKEDIIDKLKNSEKFSTTF